MHTQILELTTNLNKMLLFDHPNLPKIYKWNIERHMLYIIVEYVDGGELLDRLISVKQLSEKIVAQIMK